MYTTKIAGKSINEFKALDVTVDFYKDGEYFITHLFKTIISEKDLKEKIQGQINFYSKSTDANSNITAGDIDSTPDIVTPPDPTPEEIARGKYIKLIEIVTNYKKDLSLGVIDENHEGFTQARQDLKDSYRPEYSGL